MLGEVTNLRLTFAIETPGDVLSEDTLEDTQKIETLNDIGLMRYPSNGTIVGRFTSRINVG